MGGSLGGVVAADERVPGEKSADRTPRGTAESHELVALVAQEPLERAGGEGGVAPAALARYGDSLPWVHSELLLVVSDRKANIARPA